jgi:1,4-dihydroxy-2-naphthoate octaprenyltransferase
VGIAAAYWFDRSFNAVNCLLTLAGIVLVHFAVNLWNDYYDFRQGADQINKNRSMFGGGSGFIVSREAPAHVFRNLALISVLLALACGGLLMWRVDGGIGPVFWFVVAGLFGGYFYTAPPLKFAYRGLGELDIFLNLGPVPVVAAYYVQTGTLDGWMPVAVASLPVGLLMTALLWINQFPDAPSDGEAGKRTLVVRLGTARARWFYYALTTAAYLSVLLPPFLLGFPKLYLLGLLGIVPTLLAVRMLHRHHDDPPALLKGQAMSILAHGTAGFLSSIAFLIVPLAEQLMA